MNALVIVHLSSLDAYAESEGLEKARELADRLREAILSWSGPVYIIDQRWPIGDFSDARWNLVNDVQLARDIGWTHFEDSWQDWDIFMKKFRSQLIRHGIKQVTLGGVWYDPRGEGGCVADLGRVFKLYFKVKVDKDLVGCWSAAA